MGPDKTKKRQDGVGAIICNLDGRVLVGKRKGSHGAGTWGLPGGHVDDDETIFETARREVGEETGLDVRAVQQLARTKDDFVELSKYYRTHFVYCEMNDPTEQPVIREPEKCDRWEWMSWDQLRTLKGASRPDEVIFRPLFRLLESTPDFGDLRPGK